MILIGVDPHKGSHTAVAVDGDEHRYALVVIAGGYPALCDGWNATAELDLVFA